MKRKKVIKLNEPTLLTKKLKRELV